MHTNTLDFHAAKRIRVPKELAIESDGCKVTVTVGQETADGDWLTCIDVTPDSVERGGDGKGYAWEIIPGDSPGVIRVRRLPKADAAVQK